MADAVFETYYAPGLALKYAVRSSIITIVLATAVPIIWFTSLESQVVGAQFFFFQHMLLNTWLRVARRA